MAEKAAWKALLQLYAGTLDYEYDLLLYGKSQATAVKVNETFGDLQGTVFEDRKHAELFFGVGGGCYR